MEFSQDNGDTKLTASPTRSGRRCRPPGEEEPLALQQGQRGTGASPSATGVRAELHSSDCQLAQTEIRDATSRSRTIPKQTSRNPLLEASRETNNALAMVPSAEAPPPQSLLCYPNFSRKSEYIEMCGLELCPDADERPGPAQKEGESKDVASIQPGTNSCTKHRSLVSR